MRILIFFAVIGVAIAQAPQTPAGPSSLPGVTGDGAGGLKTRGNITVGASTTCPGGAPVGSVCAVKVYGDGSALTGPVGGGGDMTVSTYITTGAGAPSNPCAAIGIQYWNTSTTPRTEYYCPSAGGNWLGPFATTAYVDTAVSATGGTTSASFCLSTTGPCFKNVAGTIKMVTDSAGATDAPIEASAFNAPAGTAFAASGAEQASTYNCNGVPCLLFDSTLHLPIYKNGAGSVVGQMALNPITSDAVITDLYSVIGDGGARKVKAGPAVAQAATANAIAQRNSSGEVIAVNAVATGKTAMATDTAVADAQLAAKHKVWSRSLVIFDPAAGDTGLVQFQLPYAGTVTSISCSVKVATSVTINLEERAVATPDTAGTAVLTSDLACDTNSETSTTFSNATLAADVPVALTISAVTGSPAAVRVYIKGTID